MDFEKVRENIRLAVKKAGGQVALAEKIGMKQSQISDYLTGKTSIENMTLGTFARFFPEIEFKFWKDISEPSDMSAPMEKQMLSMFRDLSYEEQAQCIAMIAANFPEHIKEKMK